MDVSSDPYQYAQVPQNDIGFDGGKGDLWEQELARRAAETDSARLAAATLFGIMGNNDPCKVETGSVYGPAIVMPQFARSAGWEKRITELALRSLLFVVVNILIQGCILSLFSKEQVVFDRFAGRMALCDFGADMVDCPDHPGCTGPGGESYSPLKRYSFAQWMNRNFVKESLLSVFPEKADEIHDKIDPGEYGVESTVCRLFCCFLYMMALTKDALQIYELCRLLYHVPTRAEFWLYYENPPGSLEPEMAANKILRLEQVKLRIAGMPFFWKMFNIVFIMLPKMLFWFMTADLGIAFLMNTSDITDSIVNSMALAFILSIDELIFETATAGRTKYMMESLEPFHVHKLAAEKEASEDSIVAEEQRHQRSICCHDFFPHRLVLVFALTFLFLGAYYHTRCERIDDGTWISKNMFLPKSLRYSFLTAYFPFLYPLEVESEPYWTMPAQP